MYAFKSLLSFVFLALCIAALVSNTNARSRRQAECRYWCRTPENKYYCCENSTTKKPDSKRCPPVRGECPKFQFASAPPQSCSSDRSCGKSDKCCFDRCLKQHVCKRAE